MSDIFISYASEERDRVLPLVSALEKTGWSIFWDRTIPAGKTWRQVIGSEIRACRSVLVVWTENSITSEWVLEEAETGKRRGILIPVLLDNVEPPFGFGNIQAANLTAWTGDNSGLTFTHLVTGITTILGPSPTAAKEAEERRRSDAEVQRRASEERLGKEEHHSSKDDARRQAEEEAQRRVEQANSTRQAKQERIPAEIEQMRKESPAPPRSAPERQDVRPSEPSDRPDRRQVYALGSVAAIISLAVLAFWFFGSFASKDADVNNIVSLGIQGKRQLNIGEKTVLKVGGRFSDGSETALTKNLEWQSSDNSVVAVSGTGQVEARQDGFADITVHYEGVASPPLTLVVKKESRSTEADLVAVATKIQEHVKTAASYRDRGEYSPALAELAKAKSLDPGNKDIQSELESTTRACLAEQRIVLTNLRCE